MQDLFIKKSNIENIEIISSMGALFFLTQGKEH